MKEIEIKFKSEMENIKNMRNMVSSLVVGYNQTISFVNELKTVVSEGITNAIVHAYKGASDKDISMKIRTTEEGIYILIEDYGCGIADVAKAREALYTTEKKQDHSGLGFTVMELFSTTFLVESEVDKGTKLSIFKRWE